MRVGITEHETGTGCHEPNGMKAFRILLVAIFLSGCAATKSSLDPVKELADSERIRLCGRVIYNGHNREYLPLSLRESPDRRRVQMVYQYEVSYGVEDDTAFDLFNPLLLMGMSKSEDSVVVLGKLEIRTDSDFERIYKEVVVLSKSKTIFSEGETLTEIRRKGLLQMRNLMDLTLARDRSLFARHGVLCERED